MLSLRRSLRQVKFRYLVACPAACLSLQGAKYEGEKQGTARANMDSVVKGWFSEISPMWPGEV